MGRPIELLVEDTQVKPPVAVTKAEKLVYKDGCKALIGVFSSGVGLALAENIDKLNVPFLSTHVMTTKFYGLQSAGVQKRPAGQRPDRRRQRQRASGAAGPERQTYYVLVHDYSWGHDAGRAIH